MKLIDSIREWLFGRCPRCRSWKVKGVKGWPKATCKDCGYTWGKGF